MLLATILLCVITNAAADVPLNDFIGHFEGLTYNKNDLISSHERLKRTVGGERHVELKFTALDKNFHFKLHPDLSLFSDDFKLTVNGRFQRTADMSVYYSGKAVGDPSTSIRGDVSHGVFVGTITTPDEEYHIEPASHHFKEEQSFHSVIYRSSDVRFDALKGKTCGLSDHAIVKKMAEDQKKVINAEFTDHIIHRRQAAPNRQLTRCKLFLRGDARFYEAVTTSVFTEEQRTIQAMAYLSNAVGAVNGIYESTIFYGNGPGGDGIGFEIAGIDILTQDTGFFTDPFLGVQSFLGAHSHETFDAYCASYRFTYRDFNGGVLGLAYVAQPGANGGICSRTLNTGVVTLINFGQRVPDLVVHLTFAHELGHNFGSSHDPTTSECTPLLGGNFLMFSSASTGQDPNNNKFSPCSIRLMNTIISGTAQAGDDKCFIEDPGDCGNGVLDSGEDCDCMFDYNDDTGLCNSDRCCNGMTCRLASGARCTPTVDVCCERSTCRATMNTSFVCSPTTECAQESRCDGMNSKCPTPAFITGVNGSALACLNNTGTCVNGTCSGSLCLLLNLEECQCSSAGEACSLCCREDSSSSTCTPVSSSTHPLAANLSSTLPPGGFCRTTDGETGYCDFTQKCRPVDGDGALQQLKEFFTSSEFRMVIQWIEQMWWVLVVGVVVLIGILFVVVLICHCTLPKPKYQKQKVMYRETLRRYRQSEHERRRQARARAQRRVHHERYNEHPPQYRDVYKNPHVESGF